LAYGLASSTATLWPTLARAVPDKLKIGFVYSGPVADVGWTYQHDLGRKMVEREFGPRVQTTFVESVPESADADRVIRQMAMDGCKLIFTTSFGFMDPTLRVAADFPEVVFEHCSGYKTARNVGVYQTRFYEGAYLLGILGGKMTKSNTMGYVAPFPIPEVIRNLSAWVIGARSVNPKIGTNVVWVNSWYDPGRERDAAQALINQGADVLYQNTDSPAIVELAQEKGLYAFGQDSDMSKFGPRAHLSGNVANWGIYYVAKVRQVLDGKWKSEDTKWGMKEGMVKVVPPNNQVPPEIAALFESRKADIVAGRFNAFTGPIKDSAGVVRVAAGKTLAEEELWTMKWYAEGVMGKQP
jgi:simple sugar transport system substrate-binding protein